MFSTSSGRRRDLHIFAAVFFMLFAAKQGGGCFHVLPPPPGVDIDKE